MAMTADQQVTQRGVALALANEIRIERANIRRQVHAMPRDKGCRAVAAYIDHPPRALESVKTSTLIDFIWGVGRMRGRRFLRGVGIYRPEAELQELTDAERRRLILALNQGI